MTRVTKNDDDRTSAPSPSIVFLMLTTIADTTWRLFVPSIGGTVAGLVIDTTFRTKPWFTIAGVTIGTAVALFLVYAQLKKVKS